MNKFTFVRNKANELLNASEADILDDGESTWALSTADTYEGIAQTLLELVNDGEPENVSKEIFLAGMVRAIIRMKEQACFYTNIDHNNPSHTVAREKCRRILEDLINNIDNQESMIKK